MTATIAFLELLRISRLSKFSAYSLKEGVEFLPCSLSFALHSTLSLMALHGMNIPCQPHPLGGPAQESLSFCPPGFFSWGDNFG